MKYQTSAAEHEEQRFYIMSFQSLGDCMWLCVSVCVCMFVPFKFANGFMVILFLFEIFTSPF